MPGRRIQAVALAVMVFATTWAWGQNQQLVGVGVLIQVDDNGVAMVAQVVPGGPAERAGIKARDELLAIDGRSVADIPEQSLPNLIRGQEGSEVALTIRTPGERPRRLAIKRAAVTVPPGFGQGPMPAPKPMPMPRAGEPNLPRRAAPDGFTVTPDPETGGYILISDTVRGGTGEAMMRNAMRDLSSYFEAPPQLTTGIVDSATGQAQGTFLTKLDNKPVRGIVTATPGRAGGQPGRVGIIYDADERIGQSMNGLMNQLGRQMPTIDGPPAGTAPVELQMTRLPDNSGSIRLPPNWRIVTANQGTVEANGPNGEIMALGVGLPFTQPTGFFDGPFSVPYSPPEQAVVAVTPALNASSQAAGAAQSFNVRVLESQRTEYPGGQAAFIMWESDQVGRMGRVPMKTFALVITAPAGAGTWMFYLSGVAAPKQHFAASFPSMMESWKSWKIDDRVFAERLKKAAETMRETTQILQSANQTQQKAFDKSNAAWHGYLSGYSSTIDAATGRVVQKPTLNNPALDANGNPRLDENGKPITQDLSKWTEEQNRQAGYDRYKVVPPG